MKDLYEKPEMEVIEFETKDIINNIITDSNNLPIEDGDTDF